MTAPAIITSRTRAAISLPGNRDFLEAIHPVYAANKADWIRDERRYAAGTAILSELWQHLGESTTRFEQRKQSAQWIAFGRNQAAIIAGHLAAVQPSPSWGDLGDVRRRKEIRGDATYAELFYYGFGTGQQWPAFTTGVQERAIMSGYRWTYVEMPARRDNRDPDAPISKADVLAGHRPYLIEYSPLRVPYWEESDGRLDWAVVRTRVGRSGIVDGVWRSAPNAMGYYLLVREGYTGLGAECEDGGWWLLTADKELVTDRPAHGSWVRMRGQVPLYRLVADESEGTDEAPALARSMTFPLDQITCGLMNSLSAREANAWNASKDITLLPGLEKTEFNITVGALAEGSIYVPMPFSRDGTGAVIPASVFPTGGTTVPSDVSGAVIAGHYEAARELMVQQVTSTPDSSGESKRAGFAEASAPILARFAQRRETWENSLIEAVELRFGMTTPRGVVEWPTEFKLAPLVAKIDETLARLKSIGGNSATLMASMVVTAAQKDGLLKEDDTKAVTAELVASLDLARVTAQATAMQLLTAAGAGSLGAVAEIAGMTPEQAKLLVEGSALDTADPTGGVTQ